MNEEEIMKIVLDKKMSRKKRSKILDELSAQGIDYARITFEYVAGHPEEFKDWVVEMPLVKIADQMVKMQNIFDGKY